jgi:hypothetical protein
MRWDVALALLWPCHSPRRPQSLPLSSSALLAGAIAGLMVPELVLTKSGNGCEPQSAAGGGVGGARTRSYLFNQ